MTSKSDQKRDKNGVKILITFLSPKNAQKEPQKGLKREQKVSKTRSISGQLGKGGPEGVRGVPEAIFQGNNRCFCRDPLKTAARRGPAPPRDPK